MNYVVSFLEHTDTLIVNNNNIRNDIKYRKQQSKGKSKSMKDKSWWLIFIGYNSCNSK